MTVSEADVYSNCQVSGKTTEDAMLTLYDELHTVISEYEASVHNKNLLTRLRTSFLHHKNVKSVFHWSSCLSLLLSSVALFIAYGQQNQRNHWLLLEGVIVLLLGVANCYLEGWQDELRVSELITSARHVLKKIKAASRNTSWSSVDYLSLHSPSAPVVTLQWTVRDGEVVSLPCAFLVRGDIIFLRPGQQVMVKCRQLEEEEGGVLELNPGDVYSPQITGEESPFTQPQIRIPLTARPFVVCQTPYMKNLGVVLEEGFGRPDSVLDNERFQVQMKWLMGRIVPVILAVMLIVNTLRLILLPGDVGHWTEMIFVQQVHIILPLLPVVFPVMWRLLEAFGITKVMVMHNKHKSGKVESESEDGFETESTLSSPIPVSCTELWQYFKQVFSGTLPILARTANITHALGNVTSLCCIDKKGILSWPNPTAEKVFFLTSKLASKRARLSSVKDNESDEESEEKPVNKDEDAGNISDTEYTADTVFEVLDLTQDASDATKLQFDDPSWKKHISSLKPLGLNILLNTCNLSTSKQYTKFADHVTCASQKKEGSVPVVNRRCFCELARQIGFSDEAVEIFQLQQVLGLYRQMGFSHTNFHKNAGSSNKDKSVPSKAFIKHKTPIPNMFSVVARETSSGIHQLFSQGTADIVLDSCSEFWDGEDIHLLSEADRKKILDFYQRTSMSSYSTAFSYRPMTDIIGEKISSVFIEVPEECEDIYPTLRSPTPSRSWDMESLDSRLTKNLVYYGSADSVILDNGSANSVQNVEGCFQAQCNQIFIGLITMQYQAKQDIVHMIEKLEDACIRFVHFSNENELRSRVFSEKMGLEAGWNCHISLLSEESGANSSQATRQASTNSDESNTNTRGDVKHHSVEILNSYTSWHSTVKTKNSQDSVLKGRCLSAPSAINLDTFQVKFDTGLDSVEPSPSVHSDTHSRMDGSLFEEDDTVDQSQSLIKSSSRVKRKQRRLRGNSLSNSSLENTDSNMSPSSNRQEESRLSESTNPSLSNSVRKRQQSGSSCQNSLLKSQSTGSAVENPLMRSQDMEQSIVSAGEEGYDYRNVEPDTYSGGSYPASSHPTDNTDSVTCGLGFSNRAKLPKGIENIRPHIANVDNVPLLVSLFTDCTPETTREMLKILQEYGEVVCVIGSSAGIGNTGSFIQADCSISLDPVFPQVCMKSSNPADDAGEEEVEPSPMGLASALHSIPCSLNFHRDENVNMVSLIAQARHHCMSVRMCFIFMLSCQLTLTLMQVFAALFQLPPVLGSHHLLWLVGCAVPLLSVTMVANPVNKHIMTAAQGKNRKHVTVQSVLEFTIYYAMQYLPSAAVALLCFGMNLHNICQEVHVNGYTNSTCHVLLNNRGAEGEGNWNGWYSDHQMGLVMAQTFLAFQLLLYFVCTSVSSLYRHRHLWQQSPFRNRVWCAVVPTLLLVQLLFMVLDVVALSHTRRTSLYLLHVPVATWVLAFAWPLLLLPLNELIKYRQVKLYVRHQKRARLDFGTKLGMNSPF